MSTRWLWAVVDAVAVVLCFWSVSGRFMWRQIKATRRSGLVVLVLSAFAATALGVGMYRVLASCWAGLRQLPLSLLTRS